MSSQPERRETDLNPVYVSGLSLLLNAFWLRPPSLESQGTFDEPDEGTGETPIDLRNQLEALLSGQVL
jgi:hypothetical protein